MFDKFRKKYAGEIEQAKKYTKAGIRGLNAAAKTMAEEREKRRASEQGKTVYSSESWPTGYISGDLREPTNIIGFFLTEGAPQPDRQVFNRKLYDKQQQTRTAASSKLSAPDFRDKVYSRLVDSIESPTGIIGFTSREFYFEFGFNNGTDDFTDECGASDYLFYRPIASIDEAEKNTLLAYADMYRSGIITDDIFKHAYMSMAYANGACGVNTETYKTSKIGLNAEQWIEVINTKPQELFPPYEIAFKEMQALIQEASKVAEDEELRDRLSERLGRGTNWWTGETSQEGGIKCIPTEHILQHLGVGYGSDNLQLGINQKGSVTYSEDESLITIAGPGSGKTQCHVLPNMLICAGGKVVLDLKGTIFDTTAGLMARRKEAVRFAPAEQNTARFNPFDFVSSDPLQVWSDAEYVTNQLITRSDNASDDYWENRGASIITAMIATIVLREPPETKNIDTLLDMLSPSEDGFAEMLVYMQESPVKPLARAGNALERLPEKQRESVFDSARNCLKVFDDPIVAASMSATDWNPQMLRSGSTLYLCLPPSKQASQFAPVLRTVLGMHIRALMQEVPQRNAIPVTFFLDEMPQLGHFTPVEEGIALGREFKIRFWIFAQNIKQIEDAYPAADALIGGCRVRCFMNPDLPTAEMISKSLGDREDMISGITRPVATPSELMQEAYKDKVIILSNGTSPAKAVKFPFYAYDNWPQVELPAPVQNGIWRKS